MKELSFQLHLEIYAILINKERFYKKLEKQQKSFKTQHSQINN